MKKAHKEYNVKPTLKQKKAVRYYLENGGNTYQAMIKAGYSEASALNPAKNLTNSIGFQQMMAILVDDDSLVERLKEIAMDRQDKRASLTGIDMLLKLKDRYPANKLKVQAYEQELNRLDSSEDKQVYT